LAVVVQVMMKAPKDLPHHAQECFFGHVAQGLAVDQLGDKGERKEGR